MGPPEEAGRGGRRRTGLHWAGELEGAGQARGEGGGGLWNRQGREGGAAGGNEKAGASRLDEKGGGRREGSREKLTRRDQRPVQPADGRAGHREGD